MNRLDGKLVVVTRAASESDDLVRSLVERGAEVLLCPVIRVADPPSFEPLDLALERIQSFDAILLTSKNAASQLFVRAAATRRDLAAVRMACVGEKTAAFVEAQHLSRPLVPEDFRSEGLLDRLRGAFSADGGLKGRRFLLPRPDLGREVLASSLRAEGAEVEEVLAYQLLDAEPIGEAALFDLDRASAFTFLSGNTLLAFLRVVGDLRARALLLRSTVAVIGPVAETQLRATGIRVDVVPKVATAEALVSALAEHIGH